MAEIFYRAVTQVVLIFVLETWVISVAMERTVEDTHTVFFSHIRGERVRRKAEGTWVMPREEVLREAAGTQSTITCIIRRQGVVAQWVAMWTIVKVCSRETGYEVVGRRRDA